MYNKFFYTENICAIVIYPLRLVCNPESILKRVIYLSRVGITIYQGVKWVI